MSTFNVVVIPWRDPITNESSELRIQFKFGDTWQHEYHLGDVLQWGGNDIGPREAKYVVVDGAVEGDPPRGVGEDFEVHIKNGRIEKVIPSTGQFDFVNSENAYVVVEP